MRATELINTLQGFIEKHGDNVDVELEIRSYEFEDFLVSSNISVYDEVFTGRKPLIIILGED